jgi:hypothetical protein
MRRFWVCIIIIIINIDADAIWAKDASAPAESVPTTNGIMILVVEEKYSIGLVAMFIWDHKIIA